MTKIKTDSLIFRDCLQYTGAASTNVSVQVAAYGYGMGGGSASEPHSYGEDCLTVNVWTKPTGQQNKAVLLWIYGGGKFSILNLMEVPKLLLLMSPYSIRCWYFQRAIL